MNKAVQAATPTRLIELLRLDMPLVVALILLAGIGLVVLYSATGQDMHAINRQLIRLGLAFFVMLVVAQIPPPVLRDGISGGLFGWPGDVVGGVNCRRRR